MLDISHPPSLMSPAPVCPGPSSTYHYLLLTLFPSQDLPAPAMQDPGFSDGSGIRRENLSYRLALR